MVNFNDVDLNDVDELEEFEPLPENWYLASITESKREKTQSGNGDKLSITFEILDGTFKKRKVFGSLNLWHNNSKAVNMAKIDANKIGKAVGVNNPRGSEDFHNIPLAIKIVQFKKTNGKTGNNVDDYDHRSKALNEPVPPKQSNHQQSQPPQEHQSDNRSDDVPW